MLTAASRISLQRAQTAVEIARLDGVGKGVDHLCQFGCSAGASNPRATAAVIASIAAARSAGLRIGGSANGTNRSRCGAIRRSRQSRNAVGSPPRASSTALRVKASASPCNSSWAAKVDLLRQPRGRPEGLPERPFSNGRPRCFCCFCRKLSATINFFSAEILVFDAIANKRTARLWALGGDRDTARAPLTKSPAHSPKLIAISA